MAENEQSELADYISQLHPLDDDGESVEAVLVKFIVLADWVDASGNRYLTKRSAAGNGEAIPGWDIKGLLFEGLYGKFRTP